MFELQKEWLAATVPPRQLWLDKTFRHVLLQFKAHGSHPDRHENQASHAYGLNCVLQGKGVFRDRRGRRHPLLPGTVFQRLPGVVHSTRFDPASNYVECFLVLDALTYRDLHQLRFIEPFLVAPNIFTPSMLQEFLALQRLTKKTEGELNTPALLLAIIRFLQPIMEQACSDRQPKTLLWSSLDHACRRLSNDLNQRFRLEDVAREVNLSYPTFRRIFQERIGLSPGAYRIRSRIQKAMLLLQEMSVKATAEELGYPDPFTFSEQFKRHTGMSPHAWQQSTIRTGTQRTFGSSSQPELTSMITPSMKDT